MRHIYTNMLCAMALCMSSVAIAQPIFTPYQEEAAQEEIEQPAHLAPPKPDFADPLPDYAFLLPGSIADNATALSFSDIGPAPTETQQEGDDRGYDPFAMLLLLFGATLFVFMADAWGGRRWRRRKKYRFVLDTKPEYREREVA